MIEILRRQNEAVNPNHVSQPSQEVSRFMENYFDAVHSGNIEEVNTYYANTMEPMVLPMYLEHTDQAIVVDDYLATYSCNIKGTRMHLTYILDKSEGYWQIIQGEIQGANTHH